MNGKLFVLEGPDGCGKTSLKNHLVEHIKEVSGVNTIGLSLPCPHSFGYDMIRQLLKKQVPTDMLQNLIILNAKETIDSIIKPAIDKGMNVVMDRWVHSSIVYNTIYKGTLMSSIASTTKSNNKTIDINKFYQYYFGDKYNIYEDKYQPAITMFVSVPELILKLVSSIRESDEINDRFDMMKESLFSYIKYRAALKSSDNLYKGFKIIPDKSKIYSIVPIGEEGNRQKFESTKNYMQRIFESNKKNAISKIDKYYAKI